MQEDIAMGDNRGGITQVLENKYLKLEYLMDSARILGFYPYGKRNLFAELNGKPLLTPYGDYYFRGGHRLWHSPEHIPRTYIPDNEGGVISDIANGVRIEMPPESWTQITKTVEIELISEKPQVIVRHELRNDGPWAVVFAPWALTMFIQGGIGIFPQPVGNVDDSGLLPNRRLLIWPYTKIDDPRLILRDDFILVQSASKLPPIKFGYFNPHGWLGYWIDNMLFVKRFDVQEEAEYPDEGCNVESYCNDQFIELETLGELTEVAPGKTVFHNEQWELYESLDVPFIPVKIQQLIIKQMNNDNSSM